MADDTCPFFGDSCPEFRDNCREAICEDACMSAPQPRLDRRGAADEGETVMARRPADLEIAIRHLSDFAVRASLALRADGGGDRAILRLRKEALDTVFTYIDEADYSDLVVVSKLLEGIARAPVDELRRVEARYREKVLGSR